MADGGEWVVNGLRAAGVDRIFGLHGAHIEPIFQAARRSGLIMADTRHEAAAGHAAEGYARSGNRLGVALVTAGAGFTNVLTSMANAHVDRTPVLYIAGSPPLADAETNTLQGGIDQVAMAAPITKWAHRITKPDQIPSLVAQAIRVAQAAPSGPVFLDIPMDVLASPVDAVAVEPGQIVVCSRPPPVTVAAIIDRLRQAQRPVIMVGEGAWRSGAAEALAQFAETTGLPVFSDFQAHGLLPADHPNWGGTFHKMGDLDPRPDLVLALGVRFGLFTLGASPVLLPTGVELIHVDTDARELGLVRPARMALIADSREVLTALNEAAASWPDRRAWLQTAAAARRERTRRLEARSRPNQGPMHPLDAVSAVVEVLSPDTIVVADGAESYHWLNEVIAQQRPGSYLTHGFLGAMGIGMGLAIGAKSGHPDRPVVLVSGDGAIGFTIAEFDTLRRLGLPIVVVVINNGSWAASEHFQVLNSDNNIVGTHLGRGAYHEVAKSFGCEGRLVERADEIGPAIAEALASGRPTCINVPVLLEVIPPELLMMIGRDPFPAAADV